MSEGQEYITINSNELARLKRLYKRAVGQGRYKFMFQGQEILVSFAKYYIEYIETVVLRQS